MHTYKYPQLNLKISLIVANRIAESSRIYKNFGQFFVIWTQEKMNKMVKRSTLSVVGCFRLTFKLFQIFNLIMTNNLNCKNYNYADVLWFRNSRILSAIASLLSIIKKQYQILTLAARTIHSLVDWLVTCRNSRALRSSHKKQTKYNYHQKANIGRQ